MKKTGKNILILATGILLMAISVLFFKDASHELYNGVCLGLGAGLMGLACSNLVMAYWYQKYPQKLKEAEIEYKDERSEFIRNKAKAKGADITQWLIMAAAWVTIFAKFPVWITLLLVGIFVLKNILELYFMNQYNKEL